MSKEKPSLMELLLAEWKELFTANFQEEMVKEKVINQKTKRKRKDSDKG